MRFSVWKNQIILEWDGNVPAELEARLPLKHYKPEFLEKTADNEKRLVADPRTATKNKLKDPCAITELWPELNGRVYYSESMGKYLLALSKQNLQRLKRQFPNSSVYQGQGRIEELKAKLRRFQQDEQTAAEIKKATELPAFPLKAPPLGVYQHRGVTYLYFVRRAPLFADCGMGKTYMVLTSTELQIAAGLIRPGKTLICVKLPTLRSGWLKDCAKFTNLKAQSLWAPAGKKRKQKILEALETPADIYIINHDGVRVFEKELAAKGFDKVVLDESTILKSYRGFNRKNSKGSFARSLVAVSHSADWRVIMSGTPAPNGPDDLWGQYYFLDQEGFYLEASYKDFCQTYMKEVFFGNPEDKDTKSKWVAKVGTEKQIHDLIMPKAYRLRIRDHLTDLPEKTVVKRTLPMGAQQGRHYYEMLDSFSTAVDEELVAVTVKLAQQQKLRQIAGGFLIDELGAPHPLPENPKLDMLDDLIEDEIGKEYKVVVWAEYQYEIETIVERYKHHGAVSVYGGNSGSKNLENIDKFLDDPATRVVVLHPRSAAHGITFTNAHYMIFYSFSHSAENDYQCVKRIERAGQKNAMFVYYLLCAETVDEDTYDVVQAKLASQAELIDADRAVREIYKRTMARQKEKGRRGKKWTKTQN